MGERERGREGQSDKWDGQIDREKVCVGMLGMGKWV